ncbi:MAG: LysE family translocator [Balneolales bacterium]
MIPPEVGLSFFGAAVILALAPGPDNIFVFTQAAVTGPAGGLMVTLGLCTGLMVHTSAVALGVAALFETSPVAFIFLRWVGAGYLLYLGWLAFRDSAENGDMESPQPINMGILYRRGMIMNVTNPKVSIFFLAFLPQFADPARGSLTVQLMLLGGVFIIATVLVFGTVALLAGSVGKSLLGSARSKRIMNQTAGTVFVVMALSIVYF